MKDKAIIRNLRKNRKRQTDYTITPIPEGRKFRRRKPWLQD